jgi:hypothetical protein
MRHQQRDIPRTEPLPQAHLTTQTSRPEWKAKVPNLLPEQNNSSSGFAALLAGICTACMIVITLFLFI